MRGVACTTSETKPRRHYFKSDLQSMRTIRASGKGHLHSWFLRLNDAGISRDSQNGMAPEWLEREFELRLGL